MGIDRWGDACVLWKGRQTCCYGGADSAAGLSFMSCHQVCVRISNELKKRSVGSDRRSLLFSACISSSMIIYNPVLLWDSISFHEPWWFDHCLSLQGAVNCVKHDSSVFRGSVWVSPTPS